MNNIKSKPPKYLSDFIPSLQRKVLYNNPIFLSDVSFSNEDSIVKKSGSGDTEKYEVILDTNIKYNEKLFVNLSRFSNSDLSSKKLIGSLLRFILLEKFDKLSVKKENSIAHKIADIYNRIASAYYSTFDTILFSQNCICELNDTKRVLLIDFDTKSEQEANIAAIIKYIYFGQTGKFEFMSKSAVIDLMKKKGYQLKVDCVLTFEQNVVPMYGLIFEQ